MLRWLDAYGNEITPESLRKAMHFFKKSGIYKMVLQLLLQHTIKGIVLPKICHYLPTLKLFQTKQLLAPIDFHSMKKKQQQKKQDKLMV